MISTAWYYDKHGHLIEVTANTFEHTEVQAAAASRYHHGEPRWHGPWPSLETAVRVWEIRNEPDVETWENEGGPRA